MNLVVLSKVWRGYCLFWGQEASSASGQAVAEKAYIYIGLALTGDMVLWGGCWGGIYSSKYTSQILKNTVNYNEKLTFYIKKSHKIQLNLIVIQLNLVVIQLNLIGKELN